jgi:hypothetical protein
MVSKIKADVFEGDTLKTSLGGPVDLTGHATVNSWVGFDQGPSFSITDSFQISSMSDDTTGQATAYFTNAYANVGYAAAYSQQGSAFWSTDSAAKFTTSCKAYSYNYNGAAQDLAVCSFAFVGNLA